jgi:Tol biopolymer transport system component
MAYVQQDRTTNLQQIGFDASRGIAVGQPVAVTRGSTGATWPDLSPDGEWLAVLTGGQQEDLAVVRVDGSNMRRLTEDRFSERGARWSPDGKRIAFFSNRSGANQIWTINPDGSDLQQLTFDPQRPAFNPVWSPDGSRLAYNDNKTNSFILQIGSTREQLAQPLSSSGDLNVFFLATSWSPDGKLIAGHLNRVQGFFAGISLYSFESQTFERLTEFGGWPLWLRDGRRLLFHDGGKLYLVDRHSRKVHEVLAVATPHELFEVVTLSRDNQRMYFGQTTIEADVWLATLR